MGNYWVRAFS